MKCKEKPKAVKTVINRGGNEKGITLISLVIMIILVVLLAAVTLKGVTGQEGILVSSGKVASQYGTGQYKEQLDQVVHGVIIEDSIKGQDTTLENMAGKIKEQSWVKDAVVRDGDIIVTADNGDIFQVYYDPVTGKEGIEYIGKDNGDGGSLIDGLPTLKVTYDKANSTITAEATCTVGIEKIELIYKNQIVKTSAESSVTFDVENTGWYQVKVTSAKGQTKYAWVKVSRIGTPQLVVTSNGQVENEWYGKDNTPVEVTISADSEVATGIYYRTNRDEKDKYTYVEGKTARVTVNTSGITMIYAYTVDKNKNESEIGTIVVKYDNVKPEIGNIEIKSGTKTKEDSKWYTSTVEVLPTMTDETSKINGYYWWIVTNGNVNVADNQKNYAKGVEQMIKIAKEGETTIAFQAKDNAGNASATPKTIDIAIDTQNPKSFELSVAADSITKNSFVMKAKTTDDTSQIDSYSFYVGDKLVSANNTTGEYKVGEKAGENIEEGTGYVVYVDAFDKAGNKQTTTRRIITTQGAYAAGGNDGTSGGGATDPTYGKTASDLKIGDYVSYVPNGETSYRLTKDYNGVQNQVCNCHTSTSTVNSDWRILNIYPESRTVQLISTSTGSAVAMQGMTSYSMGPTGLNITCSSIYSNSFLGTSARNVTVEDFKSDNRFLMSCSSAYWCSSSSLEERSFWRLLERWDSFSSYRGI